MLCVETPISDRGIVMKTIYVNETNESLEVQKEKIQGEWTGFQMSVDSKVLDVDEMGEYLSSLFAVDNISGRKTVISYKKH